MTDRVFVSRLNLADETGGLCVDMECALDLAATRPGETVDHHALCALAQAVHATANQSLEALGQGIAASILEQFYAVNEVVVRLRQPSLSPQPVLDHVGVEVCRRRRRRIGLSFGSNMGHKIANIQTALSLLRTENVVEFDAISAFYSTRPWGNVDQDRFINACATGWTTMLPQDVLKACKRIEFQVGRVPTVRWGPRAIDVDILFIDHIQVVGPELTLPHAELFNRAFVLVPLAEIAGDEVIAGRRIGDEVLRMELKADEVEPVTPSGA